MQGKTGILFLLIDKFQIYSPYLPNILEFRFVPELIRDYDLINKELLENLIKVFLANNKIAASNMVIIVADNASFIKDFMPPQSANQQVAVAPSLENLQDQANKFLEYVPFENVTSKVFPLTNGVRAYATNQDIYEGIKSVLEKQGFIIDAVIPQFAFAPELNNKFSLDGQAVGIILQKIDLLKEYNLLKERPNVLPETTEPSVREEVEEKEGNNHRPKENKRLVMIIAAAVLFLIVLITGIILYQQFTYKPYVAPAAPSPSATVPAVVKPTVTSVITPPATIDVTGLTVQIVSSQATAAKAEAIRNSLIAFGFKSISLQTQENLGSAQNSIILSTKLNPQVKEAVTNAIKKALGDILIQEKSDSSFDIVVILGQ